MAILDFLFGRTRPQATSSTVNQRSVLPDEVAPYIKEINEEAQRLYAEKGEYKPYEGETIAPRTVEEEEAISGLRGLVGTQDPYRAESEALLRGIPREFTSEIADRFMDPYQQNVTDVIKRKAGEDFQERIMPQFERKAIREGGGPGGLGTRAGVAAAMLGENLQTQLSDIQTVGQQKAFQDAYGRFTDQSARDRTFAGDIGAQGTQKFNIGLAEQGLKQTLGQADREEAQALLNRDFGDYIEEEEYDQSELAQYASFINSNPFLRTPSTQQTSTNTLQPTTSTAQQLLSAGLTGLNLFGRGGGFGTKDDPNSGFSLRNFFSNQGGYIRGGLDSLPIIRRQENGRVGGGMPAYLERYRKIMGEGAEKPNMQLMRKTLAKRITDAQQGKEFNYNESVRIANNAAKARQETGNELRTQGLAQFENPDRRSGPIGAAIDAINAPGMETKGLIGALSEGIGAYTGAQSKAEKIRKAEIAAVEREALLRKVESDKIDATSEEALRRQEVLDTKDVNVAEAAQAEYLANAAVNQQKRDLAAANVASQIITRFSDAESKRLKVVADKIKDGKGTTKDMNNLRKAIAPQFGYTFDENGLKYNGDVLSPGNRRLVEFEEILEKVLKVYTDSDKDVNKTQTAVKLAAQERFVRQLDLPPQKDGRANLDNVKVGDRFRTASNKELIVKKINGKKQLVTVD